VVFLFLFFGSLLRSGREVVGLGGGIILEGRLGLGLGRVIIISILLLRLGRREG